MCYSNKIPPGVWPSLHHCLQFPTHCQACPDYIACWNWMANAIIEKKKKTSERKLLKIMKAHNKVKIIASLRCLLLVSWVLCCWFLSPEPRWLSFYSELIWCANPPPLGCQYCGIWRCLEVAYLTTWSRKSPSIWNWEGSQSKGGVSVWPASLSKLVIIVVDGLIGDRRNIIGVEALSCVALSRPSSVPNTRYVPQSTARSEPWALPTTVSGPKISHQFPYQKVKERSDFDLPLFIKYLFTDLHSLFSFSFL